MVGTCTQSPLYSPDYEREALTPPDPLAITSMSPGSIRTFQVGAKILNIMQKCCFADNLPFHLPALTQSDLGVLGVRG